MQHALRNHVEYGLIAKIRASMNARERGTHAKCNSLAANFNYQNVERIFLILRCPAKCFLLFPFRQRKEVDKEEGLCSFLNKFNSAVLIGCFLA